MIRRADYLDSQRYSECRLVAAINAAVRLGKPRVDPASQEYERLVDFTWSRYGPGSCVGKMHHYLQIEGVDITPRIQDVRRLVREGRPVEVLLYRESLGLHSVTATHIREDRLRIWNLRGFPAWVPSPTLSSMMHHVYCRNRIGRCVVYRLDARFRRNGK